MNQTDTKVEEIVEEVIEEYRTAKTKELEELKIRLDCLNDGVFELNPEEENAYKSIIRFKSSSKWTEEQFLTFKILFSINRLKKEIKFARCYIFGHSKKSISTENYEGSGSKNKKYVCIRCNQEFLTK